MRVVHPPIFFIAQEKSWRGKGQVNWRRFLVMRPDRSARVPFILYAFLHFTWAN